MSDVDSNIPFLVQKTINCMHLEIINMGNVDTAINNKLKLQNLQKYFFHWRKTKK
jgi:hypothetical protein